MRLRFFFTEGPHTSLKGKDQLGGAGPSVYTGPGGDARAAVSSKENGSSGPHGSARIQESNRNGLVHFSKR